MNKNVLKFKKKSRWELLGRNEVNTGHIIITDAENFPKYFHCPHHLGYDDPEYHLYIKKQITKHYPTMDNIDFGDKADKFGFIHLLAHDVCMRVHSYSGHIVDGTQRVGGSYPIWGRFVESETNDSSKTSDVLNDLLIYCGDLDVFQINDFEKVNKCSIDIYSGKIGIDEPEEIDERGLVVPTNIYDCPLGNGAYDIYDINIMVYRHSDLNNPDSEVVEGKEPFGTLIELNPKEKITKGSIGDLISLIHNARND